MATKEQAVDKLKEYGQEHVLKYFDELSADEQQSFMMR